MLVSRSKRRRSSGVSSSAPKAVSMTINAAAAMRTTSPGRRRRAPLGTTPKTAGVQPRAAAGVSSSGDAAVVPVTLPFSSRRETQWATPGRHPAVFGSPCTRTVGQCHSEGSRAHRPCRAADEPMVARRRGSRAGRPLGIHHPRPQAVHQRCRVARLPDGDWAAGLPVFSPMAADAARQPGGRHRCGLDRGARGP